MGLEIANLTLAAYLTGVIWVIQLVHYPLFARVGHEQWTAYEAAHQRRITVVVGPPMLAQPAVALGILLARPGALAIVNLVLCGALLAITLAVFAPLHGALAERWSDATHRRLVGLNVLRTVAWTSQAGIAIALLVAA